MRAWVLLGLLIPACSSLPVNPWGKIAAPSAGEARPIGAYSGGCISGAVALPPDGPGYAAMRLSRHRVYGHPELVKFIEGLGKKVRERKLGTLLVGDLAQPRGGPMTGGHDSHQTGLDVDLWFDQPEASAQPLSAEMREAFSARSVLTAAHDGLDRARFSSREAAILTMAAQDPRVARIFVDPWIKKSLCASNRKQPWLAKLRPWWKHDDHFHVRLNCPADATSCLHQDPVPAGTGCDASLDWWFTAEAAQPPKSSKKPELPKLPEECSRLLEGL